jgi:hypothetical protein
VELFMPLRVCISPDSQERKTMWNLMREVHIGEKTVR